MSVNGGLSVGSSVDVEVGNSVGVTVAVGGSVGFAFTKVSNAATVIFKDVSA